MQPPARLSVDLGTTHTVAVFRRGDQQPRTLLFDGGPLLPSGVYVDPAGTIHTGRDAARLARLEPHRFEPYPKRRVDEGMVYLGEAGVPVANLLAAILARVAGEARQAGLVPGDATVLTCPADWGQPRREVLRDAARTAGLGEVLLVDEPVAAATYCVDVLGQQIHPGTSLAIFDFGGGTLDVAVVRREPAGFRVLGTGGLDDLGGLDIDAALVGHLGQLIGVRDPQLWHRLSAPDTTGDLRDRHTFWSEVRMAKEALSRASSAPVQVPGRDDPLHLTREELDRVAGPLVARAVDETRRVLERTGVMPVGLLLVGGTSRLPLVASRLHARLGIPPAVPEQPELPVAYGALLIGAPASGPGPVSPAGGYAPVSPATGSYLPVSPAAGGYPHPPGSGAGPVWTEERSDEGRRGRTGPGARAGEGRRRRHRTPVVLVAAALAVALAVTGGVLGVRWLTDRWKNVIGGQLDGLGNQPSPGASGVTGPTGSLQLRHDIALPPTGGATVLVAGDRAYYAVAALGHTDVVALPAKGGNQLWKVSVPIEPSAMTLTLVGEVLVVDGDDSALDDGDVRATVDTAKGTFLWKKAWADRRDIAYVGTDVIFEDRDEPAIQRINLRTGASVWRRPGPDTLLVIDEWRGSALTSWPAQGAKAPTVRPPTGGSMYDMLAAGTDVVELNEDDGRGFVLDGNTGQPRSSGALPLDDELWTAFDGLVIGKRLDVGNREALGAYRTTNFGRAWSVDLQQGTSIEFVKPCGPKRICVALGGSASGVVAYDTASGGKKWEIQADSSDDPRWYAAGERLLYGDGTFATLRDPSLLDLEGKQVVAPAEFVTAMACQGGRVAVRDIERKADGQWTVSIVDMGSGRRSPQATIGPTADVPMTFSVSGDFVAAIGANRHVLVYQAGSL